MSIALREFDESAQRLATLIANLPDEARRRELSDLKAKNPTLHARVAFWFRSWRTDAGGD